MYTFILYYIEINSNYKKNKNSIILHVPIAIYYINYFSLRVGIYFSLVILIRNNKKSVTT